MPIRSLHHVSFAVTDLAKTQQFAEDFGLLTVEQGGQRLTMQTSGGDAWCYMAEQADEAGFTGLGFLVDSESDLENAIRDHGATAIRDLDTPGGGRGVTLTNPEGLKINLVHGIQSVPPKEMLPELRQNTPANRTRHADPQVVRPLGPQVLYRLGHVGLYVRDYKTSAEWFENVLGMKVSDSMHIPGQPDQTISSFMRIDRGKDWVDHHQVFLAQSDKTDLHHISFEAQDYEAQFRAHRWLLSRGWDLNWGVGRHPLGCHVFDTWFGPDRYRFESYTDTDLINEDHKAGHYDVSGQEMDQWCPDPPDRYFA